MTYEIVHTADGTLIQRVARIDVALFHDDAAADIALAALNDAAPVTARPMETKVVTLPMMEVSEPEIVDPAPAEAEATPAPEIDWMMAFDRIATGEKIAAVAEEIGVPWTALRARWAAEKKLRNRNAAPVEEQDEEDDDASDDPFTIALGAVIAREMTCDEAAEHHGVDANRLRASVAIGTGKDYAA